jgi:hypothetical protein
MPIDVDWGRIPISIRSEVNSELSQFLNYLKKDGLKKHSIIMPDREHGGYIFFIYEKIEENTLEKWNKEGE